MIVFLCIDIFEDMNEKVLIKEIIQKKETEEIRISSYLIDTVVFHLVNGDKELEQFLGHFNEACNMFRNAYQNRV